MIQFTGTLAGLQLLHAYVRILINQLNAIGILPRNKTESMKLQRDHAFEQYIIQSIWRDLLSLGHIPVTIKKQIPNPNTYVLKYINMHQHITYT